MSMRENLHFEMYRTGDVTPDWIKNERYEYCEDFYGSLVQKSRNSFKKFVTRLQMFMFL